MPLNLPSEDKFEDIYTAKFKELASSHGIFIAYERDRAAIDLGLHLSAKTTVTDTRVWFQLKGIHSSTLEAGAYAQAADVALCLEIEHLRHWYRSPEAVYLVVYVECKDEFLAIDVRTFVNGRWGDELFLPETFGVGQKTVLVRIPKAARLEEAVWSRMLDHRSMRTDGVSYRGNPLPHTRDIRSSRLLRMEPELFRAVVAAILKEHRFRESESWDPAGLFLGEGDEVSLWVGTMFEPYEWVLFGTSEFIGDEDGYRQDGKPFRLQGKCAVLVHSIIASRPNQTALSDLARRLKQSGVVQVAAFVNHFMSDSDYAYNCFPEYRMAFRDSGVWCVPQHIEDMGRNILTSSKLYLEFCDKIRWWGASYLKQKHGKIYLLNHDGSRTEL